jgi:D-methionine transport system substrate-binding protein
MPKPYTYYSRTAVYSVKHKTIDAIPQNALIAVPGDPSNMDRSLLTLRDMGLLTLGEKTGNFYTILDIKDNPKNIKIIETEITQTIRSINDVDAVITGANRVKLAGLDPNAFLYDDPTNKNYPIGLVVNAKDMDAQWVKDAMKVTQSEEFKSKFNKHFNGTYVLYNN